MLRHEPMDFLCFRYRWKNKSSLELIVSRQTLLLLYEFGCVTPFCKARSVTNAQRAVRTMHSDTVWLIVFGKIVLSLKDEIGLPVKWCGTLISKVKMPTRARRPEHQYAIGFRRDKDCAFDPADS